MAEHTHDLRPFRHSHAFADDGLRRRERALIQVTLITLAVMVVELAAGWWSGSLALLADGWHMGTHALAIGGAVLAYRLSARAGEHAGYAFGGWKIEVLTAYTSGIALLGAAVWIAADAVATLRAPQPIAYREAMAVAVLGLVVNLLSAWLMSRSVGGHGHAHHDHGHDGHDHHHGHDHGHHHGHPHGHHHHDHNFSAAYLHVLADALTSVLAIGALAGGLWFGWDWLDPVVALVGAAVIAQWALGVLRHSAKALVDATADPAIRERIRDLVEADGDAKVADLHVWQVGAQAWSAAVAVVADRPLAAADYRARLAAIEPLRHVTVEVHRCTGASPM
jgi:cation diffusion facilitator family transporter